MFVSKKRKFGGGIRRNNYMKELPRQESHRQRLPLETLLRLLTQMIFNKSLLTFPNTIIVITRTKFCCYSERLVNISGGYLQVRFFFLISFSGNFIPRDGITHYLSCDMPVDVPAKKNPRIREKAESIVRSTGR